MVATAPDLWAHEFRTDVQRIEDEVGKVMVGQSDLIRDVLICILAGWHALLEGVPGLGKTQLVRTLADVLDLQFSRSDTSNRDAAFGLTQPARNYRDLMPIDRPRYVRFCGEMLKRRVRASAGARCLVPLRNA